MEPSGMKMVIVIIQDENRQKLLNSLIENGFRATQLASTGGFLHAGNTTMMIGVEERRLEELLRVIKQLFVVDRPISSASTNPIDISGSTTAFANEITPSNAIVFVLDIERFVRF